MEDLARESGYGSRQLRRRFDEHLAYAPECRAQHREACRVLIDGTWFDDRCRLVVYRDAVRPEDIPGTSRVATGIAD